MCGIVQKRRACSCYKHTMRCQWTETPAYLRAEFGYGTATEIAELFRALAVTCIQKRIARVLVVAGDDDRAGEHALRDALTTIVLAGVPDDFRLALVAAAPRVKHTYRDAQRDFTAAGATTRLFDTEEEAARWLGDARGETSAHPFQVGGSPDGSRGAST
jgi:hypothetical protein